MVLILLVLACKLAVEEDYLNRKRKYYENKNWKLIYDNDYINGILMKGKNIIMMVNCNLKVNNYMNIKRKEKLILKEN